MVNKCFDSIGSSPVAWQGSAQVGTSLMQQRQGNLTALAAVVLQEESQSSHADANTEQSNPAENDSQSQPAAPQQQTQDEAQQAQEPQVPAAYQEPKKAWKKVQKTGHLAPAPGATEVKIEHKFSDEISVDALK